MEETLSMLAKSDPEVYEIIQREHKRQQSTLEMIASENHTSAAVLEAAGSCLTNKYAEGLPGKRWYGGCDHVDQVENLAIERCKQLFGCEHVNVQPHSGTQANMAVYFSCLEPGDTVLAMDLAHGGHLSHGSKVNFSGKLYRFVSYGVKEDDHRIDYDQVHVLAKEHKPKIIVCGASAYPRKLDFDRFAQIAEETGARAVIQTDALEDVLRSTQGRKEEAARKALLHAIEQNPLALYRYKAMKALKEMGGPDLLKKEEEEKAAAAKNAAEDAVEDEGETTMEEGPPDDD